MKAYQSKFIKIALMLLLNQIYTVWEEKDNIITLLSFNISEAFSRILQKQLTHVMKHKKVSRWLINWIFFFMLNRKIILIFDNQKSKILNILIRILQDFFLFLILFLFYNVEFLEICNSTKVEVNSLAFINNVNLLIYKLITERNCKQLEAIHDRCLLWIKKYRTLFASEKYILIHFLTKRRFNMKVLI